MDKSVGDFSVFPYVAGVLNCAFWIAYSRIETDSLALFIISVIGLVVEIFYIVVYVFYAPKEEWVRIGAYVGISVVLLGVLIPTSLLSLKSHNGRHIFVGICCITFNVLMYGAPLSTMKQAIDSGSPNSLPIWIVLATIPNAAFRLAYSLVKFDLFIVIAAGVGLVIGIVQLIIFIVYTCKEARKKRDGPAQNQVQAHHLYRVDQLDFVKVI